MAGRKLIKYSIWKHGEVLCDEPRKNFTEIDMSLERIDHKLIDYNGTNLPADNQKKMTDYGSIDFEL